MDDSPPPRMLCARCRRPLDRERRYEGATQVGVDYRHPPIALPEDHLPEPIPDDGPISAVTVCDFCATPGAAWEYPAHPFQTAEVLRLLPEGEIDTITRHSSDGAWGACERCHDDIERGDWNRVVYRALRGERASLRPVLEPTWRTLWRAFETHRCGPARRR
jgi:hypothetical protein